MKKKDIIQVFAPESIFRVFAPKRTHSSCSHVIATRGVHSACPTCRWAVAQRRCVRLVFLLRKIVKPNQIFNIIYIYICIYICNGLYYIIYNIDPKCQNTFEILENVRNCLEIVRTFEKFEISKNSIFIFVLCISSIIYILIFFVIN